LAWGLLNPVSAAFGDHFCKDLAMIMRNSLKLVHSPFYRSLTRNMVVTINLISLLPFLIVTGVILYQFQASYREKVYAHLAEVVRKHKQNIDTFLKEKLADIRFLSGTFGMEILGNEAILQQHFVQLQRDFGPVFVDLGVIDEHGRQLAYSGPFKLERAHYHEADWFKKAIASDHFISDVFLGLRGLPHFIVAVTRQEPTGRWLLRATIDFMAFNRLVENIRIGETGFAFILNKNGEFQTQPIYDFAPQKGCYGAYFDCSLPHGEGVNIEERKDDEGKKSIYVTALLKDNDWLLVYRQQATDAYRDLYHTFWIVGGIFAVAGMTIFALTWTLSLRMVSRIALADKEKEMLNQQVIETGKLASVGELAAGIAHEINNPVAIMVEEAGWIEDLLDDEPFQQSSNLEEFKRALKQINTQGKRCKEITHKLLSFARKTDSRIQNLQVNHLISDVISLSAQRAKYSNVVLESDLDESLPLIEASQTEMQQVLLNLINNALDALERQGGVLAVSSRQVDGRIELEIRDNGPGIPRSNLGRIFDPFFTTKGVGKGTGLGLSICYGIIKKMGGEIDVKSVVDHGTTFTIRLPA
jgi:two-component system NtrC family sensor kinase